jgi:hypothetical protein
LKTKPPKTKNKKQQELKSRFGSSPNGDTPQDPPRTFKSFLGFGRTFLKAYAFKNQAPKDQKQKTTRVKI